MAHSKGTVLTARLDPILSQIMEALASVNPEDRASYISMASNLSEMSFTMKKPNGKVVKYFRDAKA
jgi:hypothetical protein